MPILKPKSRLDQWDLVLSHAGHIEKKEEPPLPNQTQRKTKITFQGNKVRVKGKGGSYLGGEWCKVSEEKNVKEAG